MVCVSPRGLSTGPLHGASPRGLSTGPLHGASPRGLSTGPLHGASPRGLSTGPLHGASPRGLSTGPLHGASPRGLSTGPLHGASPRGLIMKGGLSCAQVRLRPFSRPSSSVFLPSPCRRASEEEVRAEVRRPHPHPHPHPRRHRHPPPARWVALYLRVHPVATTEEVANSPLQSGRMDEVALEVSVAGQA